MWADALPNLLIGLREGLEGGLVVSILLAAVRRAGGRSTAPVWLGVVAALALAASFGAVLTFSEAALPAGAQDALAGTLGVLAVALVTAMVFWMRTAARGLAGELRGKVADALSVGSGALALTAFLAVAREGLETALFLWTTVQAAGSTVAPLIGAAVGVGIAVGLCVLMVRSAVRIDLGRFFSRTAAVLVVVAAGVLAYGLGDLQQAGLLPGRSWLAFDLNGIVAADTWWVTVISGVTNLALSMTWLQVVAYVAYVAVVLTLLLHRPRPSPAPAAARLPASASAEQSAAGALAERSPGATRSAAPARTRRRTAVAAVAAVFVPVLAAAVFLLVATPTSAAAAQTVTVGNGSCAAGWAAPPAGATAFTVTNAGSVSTEVYLVRSPGGGVISEIENLGPATRQTVTVALPAGDYAWRCVPASGAAVVSPAVHLTGSGADAAAAPAAVAPVTLADLQGATSAYRAYVATQLATLTGQVARLQGDVDARRLDTARADWLPAQLTWERVGAAYGSFGDLADAIDGGADGLVGGVADPGFTGLHRLEYGLWHGQEAAALAPVAAKLVNDVAALRARLPDLTADPTDLPVRAHEILEDALRDHLTGHDDEGAGAGYAETAADVDGTAVVLDELGPLIDARSPGLRATAATRIATLRAALAAAPAGVGTATDRARIDAATSGLLETLSRIPTLLEVR